MPFGLLSCFYSDVAAIAIITVVHTLKISIILHTREKKDSEGIKATYLS